MFFRYSHGSGRGCCHFFYAPSVQHEWKFHELFHTVRRRCFLPMTCSRQVFSFLFLWNCSVSGEVSRLHEKNQVGITWDDLFFFPLGEKQDHSPAVNFPSVQPHCECHLSIPVLARHAVIESTLPGFCFQCQKSHFDSPASLHTPTYQHRH